MNKAEQLIARMIVSTIAGSKDRLWDLYELYCKETRLHVPVEEILRSKRKEGIA